MVSADREIQPELYEVKKQYQNIWFTATDEQIFNEQINVYNENSFVDLGDFDVSWELVEDGKVIGNGTLTDAQLAARQTKTINISYRQYLPETKKAEAEYFLNVYVKLKNATAWANAGHELASEQFAIPINVDKTVRSYNSGANVNETGNTLNVSGNNFSFEIDKTTGAIKNYTYRGDVLLSQGPLPTYWRAPLSNDKNVNNVLTYNPEWQNVNNGATAAVTYNYDSNGSLVINVTLTSATQSALKQTLTYTVDGNGAVDVKLTVDATATSLGEYLRIGTVMNLPAGYENLSWYGNGPVESMYDRQTFAKVGTYSSNVWNMFYPHYVPQDTGTVTGLRWFSVSNPSNSYAVAIASENAFEAQALHFTADDLTQAKHVYELNPTNETVLTVNMLSRGTGSNSCGPEILSQYRIPNTQEYSYTYTIVPYSVQEDPMEVTRQYRNTLNPGENDLILSQAQAKVDNVNNFIDTLVVRDDCSASILEIMSVYDSIPSDYKSLVGEKRITKLNEALTAAKAMSTADPAKLLVIDKSKNAYKINLKQNPTSANTLGNGTVESYQGIVGFKGAELLYNTDGTEAKLNNVFGSNAPFTVDTYVNPTDPNHNPNTITNYVFAKGDNCAALRFSQQAAYFYVKNTSGQWITVTYPLAAEQMDQWLHIVAVYDGTNIKISVDGGEFNSAYAGTLATSDDTFTIGCEQTGSRYSTAHIKNLRLFNNALTLEEVAAATPNDLNVEFWFDFDEFYYSTVSANGDVNGDGVTNLLDLVRIKKMSSRNILTTWRGDIDGDAVTATALDLSKLRKYLLSR